MEEVGRWTRSSLPSRGASKLDPNWPSNHETWPPFVALGNDHGNGKSARPRPDSFVHPASNVGAHQAKLSRRRGARVWLDMHFALEIRLRRVPGH